MGLLIAVVFVFISLYSSKYLKDRICLLITGKTEFDNLDIDLVTRIIFFLSTMALLFYIGHLIEHL